MLGINF